MISLEAVLLSLFAGLATGIGGALVVLLRKVGNKAVSFSLGFAAGIMLMVAFNNLFFEAQKLLTGVELMGMFCAGAITIIVLDLTIPHIELTRGEKVKNPQMLRRGLLIAAGITLHNFPEGFVVAAGYAYTPALGIIIAVAILFHNIPEGVATAMPLVEAGVAPLKIFVITLLSGLAEPLAALLGVMSFSLVGTPTAVGFALVFAAGVMVYITVDELIPVAHEYGYKHTVSVGLLLGIIFALLINVLIS